MAMDISWTDTLRAAMSSCFPLCSGSGSDDDEHRARSRNVSNPDLAALLASDSEGDAVSLHSNFRPHSNKRKKRTLTMCGMNNLFGRRQKGIRLEGSDDSLLPSAPIRARTQSTSTEGSDVPPRPRGRYDSDAAPLDVDTVTAEEVQRRREKEERRKRRRERKARERLSISLHHPAEEHFQGFQGSGQVPAVYRAEDEYVEVPPMSPPAEDDEADLDGAVYFSKSGRSLGADGSQTHSRSSATSSSAPFSPQTPLFQQQDPMVVGQQYGPMSPMQIPKKKRKSSKRSADTRSSTTSDTLAEPSFEGVVGGKL